MHKRITGRSKPLPVRSSILSAIFIVFLSLEFGYGQSLTPSQKYSIGIKAAPNFTIARYRDSELREQFKPSFVFGYTVGAQVKFPLKDRYSFLTEVGFAQKGRNTQFHPDGRNKGTYYFVDGSMALRKSFRVKLFKDIPTQMYFNIGPNIAYWLSGHGTLQYNTGGSADYEIVFDEEPTSDFSKYYYTDVNRWLFGIDIGVGGDAPLLRKQRIYSEFRVTLGQTQLGKKHSDSYIDLVPKPYDNLLCNLVAIQFQLTYTLEFDTRASRKGKSTKDKETKRRR
jgi:hypothetical protein